VSAARKDRPGGGSLRGNRTRSPMPKTPSLGRVWDTGLETSAGRRVHLISGKCKGLRLCRAGGAPAAGAAEVFLRKGTERNK
jgi:hypothetical protein